VDNIKVFRFREKSQLPAATAFYFRWLGRRIPGHTLSALLNGHSVQLLFAEKNYIFFLTIALQ
jgi:hypothetical protein